MKTFPDGSTHKRYDVRNDDDRWLATVFIGADGVFSTVSEYGNYGHWWTSIGDDDIRTFLLRSEEDPGYFRIKFDASEVYDDAATEQAIRERIADMPEDERVIEQISLEGLVSGGDFRAWCDETAIDTPWELYRTKAAPQAVAFVERVMPRLCAILRAEAAAERAT